MKDELNRRLAALESEGLMRRPVVLDPLSGPVVNVERRDVLNLSSNDYLGLSAHPALVEAGVESFAIHGAGAGAARLVTGTTKLHASLEQEIAAFVGTERALVFGSGYLANVGAIAALASEGGTVFSDERNHASIVDACRLADAPVVVYRHRDAAHLEELMAGTDEPRIVVTESVFSMDGDRAPLAEICDVAQRHGAWVFVDEAHAFGLLGPSGRGLSCEPEVVDRVDVRMGTLGKALGCYGAFVAGSEELAGYLTSRARTFLYSTALPGPVVGAARQALRIVSGDDGERYRKMLARTTELLREGLASQGWDLMDVPGPILPIVVGDAARAVALSDRLLYRGVLVRAMRYPTVARGTERLRVVASAALEPAHLGRALECFDRVRREMT